MIKNLSNLSNEKTQLLAELGVLWKRWRVAGDTDLNKWNWGNMPLT